MMNIQNLVNKFPDNCIEHVFTHVNPYEDWNNIRLVSRRWRNISSKSLIRIKRAFYECRTSFAWKLVEDDPNHSHLLSERCSHCVCYHPTDYVMYMFGGCTSKYTSFNDLWLFDLSTREWDRVIIRRSPLPSAKALASLVLYGDNLILFGGFSKSGGLNPIHQTSTFYNELHLFNKQSNCWEEIISENTAPHLAGHTASIVGDFMLVFGGSMGSSYNNNVYVLDILRRIWQIPSIPGPCPPPRYGHSQILLDDNNLIIFGGCGGPSAMFNDVWLLEFDLYANGSPDWNWIQLKVENLELTPPYTWCHRGTKVGMNAVVASRPTKYSTNSKHIPRRRRTSSASQIGNSRLTSPDSPQDRRAVAAAFRKAEAELVAQQNRYIGEGSQKVVESGQLKPRRRPMLTSRSLDEKAVKEDSTTSEQSDVENTADQPLKMKAYISGSTNSPQTDTAGSNSSGSQLLQRTCSIPAIIVGEIPKLIVTASIEPPPVSLPSPSSGTTATSGPCQNQQQNGSIPLLDRCSPHSSPSKSASDAAAASNPTVKTIDIKLSSSLPPKQCAMVVSENAIEASISSRKNKTSFCDTTASASSSSLVVDDSSLSESELSSSAEHLEAVREYYISLLQDEYNRLQIVELSENLANIDERLDGFLGERVPYLSRQDRVAMINGFLVGRPGAENERSRHWQSCVDSGQLSRRSSGSLTASRESVGMGNHSPRSSLLAMESELGGPSSSSFASSSASASALLARPAAAAGPSNTAAAGSLSSQPLFFGQSYARKTCVYVLRLDRAIGQHVVRWEQMPVEENAPEDIILYSLVAGRGELVLFGGMRSDNSSTTGMDCLNVANERHLMSADTWILRPRYNENV